MGLEKNFNSNSIDDEVKTPVNRQDQFIDDGMDEEYEEGEVSGFVVQKPLLHAGINSFNPHAVSMVPLLRLYSVAVKMENFSFRTLCKLTLSLVMLFISCFLLE